MQLWPGSDLCPLSCLGQQQILVNFELSTAHAQFLTDYTCRRAMLERPA